MASSGQSSGTSGWSGRLTDWWRGSEAEAEEEEEEVADGSSSEEDAVPSWVLAASSLSGLSSRTEDVKRLEERSRVKREREAEEVKEAERQAKQEARERKAQEKADLALARRLQREEEEEAAAAAAAASQPVRAQAHASSRGRRRVVMLDESSEEEEVQPRMRRPRQARRMQHYFPESSPEVEVVGERQRSRGQAARNQGGSSSTHAHSQPPAPPPPPPANRDHAAGDLATAPDSLLVPSLFPYQRAALAWFVKREKGKGAGTDMPLGGLLADEQGLGKTVQIIAGCLAHPQPLSASPVGAMLPGGRTALGVLIVAPLILVRQWAREIENKIAAPMGRNVRIHHGPGKRACSGVWLPICSLSLSHPLTPLYLGRPHQASGRFGGL